MDKLIHVSVVLTWCIECLWRDCWMGSEISTAVLKHIASFLS